DLEAAKANLKSTGVDGRAASKERAGIKDPELGKVVDNLKNAGIKEEKSGLAAQNSAGKTPDQGMSIDKK
ncbi:MAG: hypothetical protein J0G32_06995, partial [Alphaproteobacteria bacterium]|nr:hypothetical protein [Alphaproteobacteria bacterium]